MAELLLQESYRPDELSALTDLPVTLIEHAAFSGELKAQIVDHDILSIRREDAIAWMANRG
ncbi:MAG: DNA-binding protein [Thermomicrobiales bacterium]|nr:DNA-binding protein [Thermomicrobiales bacterium]